MFGFDGSNVRYAKSRHRKGFIRVAQKSMNLVGSVTLTVSSPRNPHASFQLRQMKTIKGDYDGALAWLTQVCAEYDTTTAHFAILALFENRLEMLTQEIRDSSESRDVEWIVGGVWDMCDTWKREMESLLLLAEQFELPLQKLRS